jgi:hypothetical protein
MVILKYPLKYMLRFNRLTSFTAALEDPKMVFAIFSLAGSNLLESVLPDFWLFRCASQTCFFKLMPNPNLREHSLHSYKAEFLNLKFKKNPIFKKASSRRDCKTFLWKTQVKYYRLQVKKTSYKSKKNFYTQ